jgi:hypothetical protein
MLLVAYPDLYRNEIISITSKKVNLPASITSEEVNLPASITSEEVNLPASIKKVDKKTL